MLKENRKKNLKKIILKHQDSNRRHSLEDSKDDKTDQENLRLYVGNHKFSNYEKLKNESTENRCNLVKQEKLCFSRLSNTHMISTCKSKRQYQVDNYQKRNHTLLHSEEIIYQIFQFQ